MLGKEAFMDERKISTQIKDNIAIMENYQQKDGSIEIPEVLRPFTGFDRIG